MFRAEAASSTHAVQLYESDDFLSDAVADFVCAGLAAAEPALIIATPEHREGFLRRLKVLSPIKNQAIYAGFGLQAVGLHDRIDVPDDDDEVIYGSYLFLAGPTALGTFMLGAGFSDGEANVWLSLGKPVATGTILDDGLFR